MRISIVAVTLTVSAFLFLTPTRAEEWTEFRGPTGQGLSTAKNLPIKWSNKKNVAWRQAVPGKGWSSPILYKGKLYLTTALPGKLSGPQTLHVLCLDASTGEEVWNVQVFEHEATEIQSKNSHASPTPLTDGKFLFVHFGTNGTACLDLNGAVIWSHQKLVYDPRHGSGGSPALTEKSLVISCDGYDRQFVVALSRKSGKILWMTPRPAHSGRGFSFTTPLVIDVDGRQQVVSPGSDYVCSYDPKDGRELWRVNYPGGYSVVPRPVYAHGLVFVCSGYGTPSLYAIHPNGSGDVTKNNVAWQTKRNVPHNATPIVVGDELYMVSDTGGIVSCLDARTGTLRWRNRIGGNYSASPIYSEGKLYFLSEEGMGTVMNASKKFKVLSQNKLGEPTLASYVPTDGTLFIRSEKHLYRIEEQS